jgi:hypothetical protein
MDKTHPRGAAVSSRRPFAAALLLPSTESSSRFCASLMHTSTTHRSGPQAVGCERVRTDRVDDEKPVIRRQDRAAGRQGVGRAAVGVETIKPSARE